MFQFDEKTLFLEKFKKKNLTRNGFFVDKKLLKSRYLDWYRDLYKLHKKIMHGELRDLKGVEIDEWQERAEEFLKVMVKLVNDLIS